jgi:hypothetical protein
MLWVDRHGVRLQPYYEVPREVPVAGLVADDASVGYRDLFDDAVRLRLRSDVPVGSCLSGGVDSSCIVAAVNRLVAEESFATDQIGDRQKTFSAVYSSDGRYNERTHIDAVLAALNVEGNFVIPDAQRFLSELPDLVWQQDEPFGSTSIFAQWCVMKSVRNAASPFCSMGKERTRRWRDTVPTTFSLPIYCGGGCGCRRYALFTQSGGPVVNRRHGRFSARWCASFLTTGWTLCGVIAP